MTREELIENLGTLAHSGVSAFLQQVEAGAGIKADVIGQFGVGFYSVFMVADEVKVISRSYRKEAEAATWISRGDETFRVEPAERTMRGTTVEIKLKADAAEFASAWRLEQIVKKHSDFTSFPINVRDKRANRQMALWRQSPREVSDEQYHEFYISLAYAVDKPLARVHVSVDAPVHLQAILYVPAERERSVLNPRQEDGIRLYSRKVLIQEYNTDLLPQYLRFVVGVVDSEDLPLNVARQTVQSHRMAERIRTALTNRLIDELERLAAEEPDPYLKFWREFGAFIKEGVSLDPTARTKLDKLLRFPSSKTAQGEMTSLAAYVERMQADQKAIYYLIGPDRKTVDHSPHLDTFRLRDIEVFYLVDPLDGFLPSVLGDFDGKPLRNVDDPDLELPGAEPPNVEDEIAAGEFDPLLERIRKVLGDRTVEVRAGKTLRDSPCRLVSPSEAAGERDLARIRRMLKPDQPMPKKIMEINRGHLLAHNLARMVKETPEDPIIDAAIEQMYDSALLAEGLYPNPAEMVGRIQRLMEAATRE
jgi:molecular chaperone HtpG